ncbi:MAG: DUF1080 domain-containing protein [Gemmataceae bacterium]|nr:DUF1080 domain-containing protein [Gemmataceae bacterium]
MFLAAFFLAAVAIDPPPRETADGWLILMHPDDWQRFDPGWVIAGDVTLDPDKPTRLAAEPVKDGGVWVNGPRGRLPDLYTKQKFGDCEVHVEFLIAKNSNSGVKFHGVYEIQIIDTAGKKELFGGDSGGVYPRADVAKGYGYLDQGVPPKVNAARPAGEWQTLDVVWKSPRFGPDGKKTAGARIVKATMNGQVIHEDVEVKTPTGGNWDKPETPTGPLMLQCDHGPVAFRNVRIKPAK